MKLVIAEKPSVAQSIAKVIGAWKRHEGYLEGSGYLVSWCIGHLVELEDPDAYDAAYRKWKLEDLPILPDPFRWKVVRKSSAQFAILKCLMERDDVTSLICATDAGREGELIFRLVYEKAGCRKPFERLWISSMEDKAIEEGFTSLKDGHAYDNLYRAALCRAEADWLVGINASRLFTTLYNKRLTVGRVQTPTLAMLTERNEVITGFVKEKYFNVHLDCGGFSVTKEKIFDEREADEVLEKCDGAEAVMTSVKQVKKTVRPPALYDLTTLQREANRYFGYTAQETLNAAQALYEKKLITYPRTDSRFLTDDMAETAERIIETVRTIYDLRNCTGGAPDMKRLINNAKVTDHHAIIPTEEFGKMTVNSLAGRESSVLRLIAVQMLCAASRPHEYLETRITVLCEGEDFSVVGRQVLEEGWKAAVKAYKKTEKPDEKEPKQNLPEVREGQTFSPCHARKTEHYTSPPKPFTEDTLLSAMETAGNEHFDDDTEKKGLGTPATRASMIEKLVLSGYVKRKGKQLIPTEDGMQLAAVMPEEIRSPKLTAEWENTLLKIEQGKESADDFLADTVRSVKELVHKYSNLPDEERNRFGTRKSREALGVCPRCGSPVYEGKKSFYCSNVECRFGIWKESKGLSAMRAKVNAEMAKALLADGRVHVEGLYSRRKGVHFGADLVIADEGERVSLQLEFPG